MPQGIQAGPQMLVRRTLVSCSPSNQRSASPLPVPDSKGHVQWDLALAGFNMRSDTAPEEEANLL